MGHFISWGISTLLLMFLNRTDEKNSEETESQQPSKFTDDTGNQVGNSVPVVLGRALIKNPLISFYGDFENEPYTEEYGMHTDISIPWWAIFFGTLILCFLPTEHPVVTSTGAGAAMDSENGIRNKIIATAVQIVIIYILTKLFSDHLGRTTIQKGFLYYLGWQHIICWTGGEYTGIKRIWMNVYDSEVEESTETGVWSVDEHMAWKRDNPSGISAYIDDEEMFGGFDEGGGFVGNITVYFGTQDQPLDPWMVRQMTISENIPDSLKGLTPKYPMYMTAVVSRKDKEGGAYIGKQATVPEMWFEVGNYPIALHELTITRKQEKYNQRLDQEFQHITNFMNTQLPDVQAYMNPYIEAIRLSGESYISSGTSSLTDILAVIDNAIANFPTTDSYQFANACSPLRFIVEHGVWSLTNIGQDLNPAAAIFEILINTMWGCSMSVDKIDVESLLDVGIICDEEQLGISCLITKVAQANEYITKILNHINGIKFDNPITGKLTFKLIRNNYDVNLIPQFDVSNCESCEFSRLDWSETASAISVNFTDAESKYTQSQYLETDPVNRIISQSYTEKQVDGEYFTTVTNAKWLAQTTLLSAGYPLAAINLVANRKAYNVTIGDPIKVSWEPFGISQMVFRVTDIDYANLESGRISITGIEDMFGFDKIDYEFSGPIVWVDPEKEPFEIARYKYVEAPFEISRSLNTYIYAFAAQPSSETIYWYVWRYIGGNYIKTAWASTWSTVGRVAYDCPENYNFDEVGFEFSAIGAEQRSLLQAKIDLINAHPNEYNRNSGANLVIVDDEIMSYDSINILANGNYQLKGVIRGVYDTIPVKHSAESIMYFVEFALNINGNGYCAYQGEQVNELLELTTSTVDIEQEFDVTRIEGFSSTRRSEQPSVMANLKYSADRGISSEYLYNNPITSIKSLDLLFMFNPRNKFSWFNIMGHTEELPSYVSVASGVRNYIKVECLDVEYERIFDAYDGAVGANITTMRLGWADFCNEMGDKLSSDNSVVLKIGTYDIDKGLYSFDHYTKELSWVIPRFIGVVGSMPDAQILANSYVQPALNSLLVPMTVVSPMMTLTFEDGPILIEGTMTSSTSGIRAQDGNYYDLSTAVAYRIDGYDGTNAIIHRINISEGFVFRSNFTELVNNYSVHYKLYLGTWTSFIPYGS